MIHLIFNSYLTILFIRPLITVSRNVSREWSNSNSNLTRMTQRTMVASLTCLIASTANVLGMIIIRGEERDYVCLALCSLDVTFNVATVHWVTTGPGWSASDKPTFPKADLEKNESGPKKSDKGSEVYIMSEVSHQSTFDMQSVEK
ncbi:hypothetical protein BC936DRAFT_147657 [Jimgerdemannia flammicorona]|uniref:Uncharacterized protein n=1 Tax=Jimgerdemannia flammicorona TaxID=994334 RepID=A0A433D4U7_9FUNG|nr:hypothetical protein BC936DRAFT_147657 [Jimgerdemannia flammicorona]